MLNGGVTSDADAEDDFLGGGRHLLALEAPRAAVPTHDELQKQCLPFVEQRVHANHLNFGGHVSHCALTDIVTNAKEWVLSSSSSQNAAGHDVAAAGHEQHQHHNQVTMHYVSQGMLNDKLKCYVKLCGGATTVYAVKGATSNCAEQIVCIGEFKA